MLRAAKMALLLSAVVACAAEPRPPEPVDYGPAARRPSVGKSHRPAKVADPTDIRGRLKQLNDQVRQARDSLGDK